MGGYTLPSISAYANITDSSKQGPLKPIKVSLSSPVLVLHDVIKTEEDRQEVQDYLRSTGNIQSIHIPLEDSEFYGNVFVEYSSIRESKIMQSLLQSTKFDGKEVQTSFISLENYFDKNLGSTEDLTAYINA